MMQKLVGIVAALALVGSVAAVASCKSEGGGAKQGGTAAAFVDCNVVAAAIKRLADKAADPADKERAPALQTAMVEECKAKSWDKAALQCINDAKDRASMEQCESKLTKEQQAGAKEVATKVLVPAEAGGPGSAGTGSAETGSAGAGSAGAAGSSGSGSAK